VFVWRLPLATNKYLKSLLTLTILNSDSKLIKRPLVRPRPPSRLSADPKTVYISYKSPFVSTVKRVEKCLQVFRDQDRTSEKDKSTAQRKSEYFFRHKRGGGNKYARRISQSQPASTEAAGNLAEGDDTIGKDKYVSIKATGKAIEKALHVALYYQNQKDRLVEIRTGTMECVDEVIRDGSGDTFESLLKEKEKYEGKGSKEGDEDVDMTEVDQHDDDGGDGKVGKEDEEMEDIEQGPRSRNTSMIEVIVRNRPRI